MLQDSQLQVEIFTKWKDHSMYLKKLLQMKEQVDKWLQWEQDLVLVLELEMQLATWLGI